VLLRLFVLLLFALPAVADEAPAKKGLPSPLTLQAALAIARQNHPDLDIAEAQIQRQQAKTLEQVSDAGLQASLQLQPQWVKPVEPDAGDPAWVEDHFGEISVSKQLTDFGHVGALRKGGEARTKAAAMALSGLRKQRELEVMRLYFDVLIADMQAQRDREAMALSFVTLDKLRNRAELGEVSEVDLLKAESEYQTIRMTFYRSESEQSNSRARLAAALNAPGELPSELQTPELGWLDQPAPEYRQILHHLLQNNDALKQKTLLVESAQQALKAARSQRYPSISADLAAYAWERKLRRRNDAVAGLRLDVPLFQGGQVKAAIGAAQADLVQAKADRRKVELALYASAMELSGRLSNLKDEKESLKTLLDYRDYYLERSRAQYEMEQKTDLGDAMVQLSAAQLKVLRVDAALALAWKELEALAGGKKLAPVSADEEQQDENN